MLAIRLSSGAKRQTHRQQHNWLEKKTSVIFLKKKTKETVGLKRGVKSSLKMSLQIVRRNSKRGAFPRYSSQFAHRLYGYPSRVKSAKINLMNYVTSKGRSDDKFRSQKETGEKYKNRFFDWTRKQWRRRRADIHCVLARSSDFPMVIRCTPNTRTHSILSLRETWTNMCTKQRDPQSQQDAPASNTNGWMTRHFRQSHRRLNGYWTLFEMCFPVKTGHCQQTDIILSIWIFSTLNILTFNNFFRLVRRTHTHTKKSGYYLDNRDDWARFLEQKLNRIFRMNVKS